MDKLLIGVLALAVAALLAGLWRSRVTRWRLEASEAFHRGLVEQAKSVILKMDTKGKILYINPFVEELLGFKPEALLGENVNGTIVPTTETTGRDLETMIRDIAIHPDRHLSNENENVSRDGKRIWMSWSNHVLLDEHGLAHEVLCVGNDIGRLKGGEERLRLLHDDLERCLEQRSAALGEAMEAAHKAEERFRRVVDAVSDRVMIWDRYYNCVHANPAATALLAELNGAEVPGKLCERLASRPELHGPWRQRIDEVFATMRQLRGNDLLRQKVGFSHLESSFLPLRNHDGEVFAVAMVVPIPRKN